MREQELRLPMLFELAGLSNAQIRYDVASLMGVIVPALERKVIPGQMVIGDKTDMDAQGRQVITYFTGDFRQAANLAFVDEVHCRHARMLLAEARIRGHKDPAFQRDIEGQMGQHVLYALRNKGVSPRSFAEIDRILHPSSARILAFPVRAAVPSAI